LGDLYLSLPYIKRQCDMANEPLQEKLGATLTHGFCHLLGFRHDTDSQHDRMLTKEEKLAKAFQLTLEE